MQAEFCYLNKELSIDGVAYDLVKTYHDNCFVFCHPSNFGTIYMAKLSHVDLSLTNSTLTLIGFHQGITAICDYQLNSICELHIKEPNQ